VAVLEEQQLREIKRDLFPDWQPPRDLVEQVGMLVGRWPVDGFAREKLPDQERQLIWINGHAIGQLRYSIDDAQKRELVATIRPLSQVVGVDVTAYVGGDEMRRTYGRRMVVRFAVGDLITVDTLQYTNDSLRDHAERFIDKALGAMAETSPAS
jgi:hypothetical protein